MWEINVDWMEIAGKRVKMMKSAVIDTTEKFIIVPETAFLDILKAVFGENDCNYRKNLDFIVCDCKITAKFPNISLIFTKKQFDIPPNLYFSPPNSTNFCQFLVKRNTTYITAIVLGLPFLWNHRVLFSSQGGNGTVGLEGELPWGKTGAEMEFPEWAVWVVAGVGVVLVVALVGRALYLCLHHLSPPPYNPLISGSLMNCEDTLTNPFQGSCAPHQNKTSVRTSE